MATTSPNRGGIGSTYGGTQSPDPDGIDGYQKPQEGKDAENTDQTTGNDSGKEYRDDSSLGEKAEPTATDAGKHDGNAGSDAAGSGVR